MDEAGRGWKKWCVKGIGDEGKGEGDRGGGGET